MELSEECKGCLFNSQLKKVEREQGDKQKLALFKREVEALCQNPPKDCCAPLLMRGIDNIHRKIFGEGIDYSHEKKLFNGKLCALENEIYSAVYKADDPLAEAVKFAMAANYIDFARLADLNDEAVEYVLAAAARSKPDKNVLNSLKNRLKTTKTVCFLHDNCGEIVLDKILIRVIKREFPQTEVTSVVRGKEIINDVTEADAREVGLDGYARIISNGTNVPGTYIAEASAETLEALKKSDVIISKGLGNLETLYGEGFNAFYLFTCKCEHIARRFNAPLWTAVIAEEK